MFEITEYIKGFFKIDNHKVVEKWNKVFEQMAVHTRKKKPTELLLSIRPNEDKNIHEYRLCNYRPITYGSMNRALDSTSRILNKINYTINASDETKAYLNSKKFGGFGFNYDFYTYLSKIVFKRDIEDPNGFLIWIPTGQGLEDSSTKVEPKPLLYYSNQLVDANEDVIAFLSDETSITKEVDKGVIYYLFTKNEFYKLIQISNKTGDFELRLIYKHNFGEIPVIILGGDMNADGYFESYFAPYVAFGDQAISQFSDWQAIMVTSGFPYREEFYQECEVKHVDTSYLNNDNEQKYEAKTELREMSKSPYGTIKRVIPNSLQGDSTYLGERVLAADIPSIRFISPDVQVARYSGESWESLLEKAEDALHLNLANGTNQSGVAKEKDLEQERAMIEKIGGNFYDHIMLNSIKYIESYLTGLEPSKTNVSIVRGSSFNIKTETELVNEIATLKEKNVPSFFLSESSIELAKKRFSGNEISKKIFELISVLDPLFIYDTQQKKEMVLSGIVTKEAVIKSVYIYSTLLKLAIEMGNEFLNIDLQKANEIVDQEMQKFINEPIPFFDNQTE